MPVQLPSSTDADSISACRNSEVADRLQGSNLWLIWVDEKAEMFDSLLALVDGQRVMIARETIRGRDMKAQ